MNQDLEIDKLFDNVCSILGEDTVETTFDEKNTPVVQDIDQRIKVLEEYALTVVKVPGFDPSTDYIRFRKIRLIKLKRVHSLLVDVIKNKRRYTAALKKRISTGERDPEKWIRDVNEAVEIALSSKPVALCAVENRIEDYSRNIVEVFHSDDRCTDQGVVFIWGDQIADAKGPAKNVLAIMEQLHNGTSNGLEVKNATREGNTDGECEKTADDDSRREVVQND